MCETASDKLNKLKQNVHCEHCDKGDKETMCKMNQWQQVHDETRRYDMGLCMQLCNNADATLVYFDKKWFLKLLVATLFCQLWSIFLCKQARCTACLQAIFSFSVYLVIFFIVPASVDIENDTIVGLEGRNVALRCLPPGCPSLNVCWIHFSNYVVEEGRILKFLNI